MSSPVLRYASLFPIPPPIGSFFLGTFSLVQLATGNAVMSQPRCRDLAPSFLCTLNDFLALRISLTVYPESV